MTLAKYWLVDFDETLASGIITWGFGGAFTRLTNEHKLPWDMTRFAQAMLVAQERGSQSPDPLPILDELFDTMGWPRDLKMNLLADLQANYAPELFDDTLPFLQHVRDNGGEVYIVSNNPRTVKSAEALGLEPYISRILTPVLYPGSEAKPHRSLWDQLRTLNPAINDDNAVVVGDDPWSDALFASNCGLPCYVVDRLERFETLHDHYTCEWVTTLTEIVKS